MMRGPLSVRSVDSCLLRGLVGLWSHSGNGGRVQNIHPHFELSPSSPAIQLVASSKGTQTFHTYYRCHLKILRCQKSGMKQDLYH